MSRSRHARRGTRAAVQNRPTFGEEMRRRLGAPTASIARCLQAANDVSASLDDSYAEPELGYDPSDGCSYNCPRCGVRVWESWNYPEEADVVVFADGTPHVRCVPAQRYGRAS